MEGSSPLTRGKLGGNLDARLDVGLIPAHAGKTLNAAMAANPIGGSSPLTRGKLLRSIVQQGVQGLIPAHAGKTFIIILAVGGL